MKFATSAAIFAAGLGALLVASTPAVLLDTALDHVSTGRFRLALVEGSLWNGQGRLASVDSSESLTPLSRLRWAFDPLSLAGASLRWQLQIDGAAPATLENSLGGLALHDLAAQLPPTAALAAFPHAIARVGWRGVLDLRIPALSCTWSGLCEGRIQAEWRAGGVDILPGQALGDHRIEATIGTSGTMLEITALRGLALFNPFPILYPYGRLFFFKKNFYAITSVIFVVDFPKVWVTAQAISLLNVFQDFFYAICFYTNLKFPYDSTVNVCRTPAINARFAYTIVIYSIRIIQCIKVGCGQGS